MAHKKGQNLLDPKFYCSLKVDQETLDQHKSFNLFDKNYDAPLGDLEGLPPEPPHFLTMTFLQFWLHVEMPQHLG